MPMVAIEKNLILPYNYGMFSNLLLNRRTNKSFFFS